MTRVTRSWCCTFAQEGAQKGRAGLWSIAGVTFRLLQLLDRNHECKDMQSKKRSTRRISTTNEKLGPTLTALLFADVPNPCSSIVWESVNRNLKASKSLCVHVQSIFDFGWHDSPWGPCWMIGMEYSQRFVFFLSVVCCIMLYPAWTTWAWPRQTQRLSNRLFLFPV